MYIDLDHVLEGKISVCYRDRSYLQVLLYTLLVTLFDEIVSTQPSAVSRKSYEKNECSVRESRLSTRLKAYCFFDFADG